MHSPADNPTTEHRWLRRFTYVVIVATFSLIAIGGHVTSTDVGLAVPDGFTTFGHNTLLAPLEVWWYDFGTRWEHGHRLKGKVVGMLTIVMAVWLLIVFRDRSRDRPSRTLIGRSLSIVHRLRMTYEGPRPLLRIAGLIMLVAVSSQGVMGALRVSEISLTLAFVHGICGQLILCGWIVIAASLSMPWLRRLAPLRTAQREHATVLLRWAVRVLLVLLLLQLTLGSAVRHFKADKAIPDFPLTYGHVLPPMSQETLDERYIEFHAAPKGITAAMAEQEGLVSNRTPQGEIVVALSDVDLQFAHRIGAVVVCLLGLYVIIAAIRRSGDQGIVLAPALFVLALFSTQFALGVFTVLSGTAPIVATLHQATGAVLIAASTWLAVRIHLAEYAPVARMADAINIQTIAPPQPAPTKRTPVTA
ncbi:MAG: COX15/CtaA family protein [Planctomycetota bacterium]